MPIHPHLLSRLKTNWAVGMQDHVRLLRRNHEMAKTWQAGMTNGTIDDDAVIVDSPSTVNHYHPQPSNAGWLIVAVSVLAAAIVGAAWVSAMRPAPAPAVTPMPTQPQPTAPAPTPAPARQDYLEIS